MGRERVKSMPYPSKNKSGIVGPRKIILLSLLVATAMILSYVDSMFPLFLMVPVPGVKLGLSNVVVVTAIYLFDKRDVLLMILVKSVLVSLLFGSPITFMYSLSGGIASLTAMLVVINLFYKYISPIGLSVVGAIWHNIGQLAMATIILGNRNIFVYLPYLMIIGVISGVGVGCVVLYLERYKRIIIKC